MMKPSKIKVITMGDAECGKTSLTRRYFEDSFDEKYVSTIGIDYGIMIPNEKWDVTAHVFDFSGDPFYEEVRNDFYRGTQGALLVFDISNRKSFKSLERWVSEMHQEMTSGEFTHTKVVVCANKTDKQYRAVEYRESRRWADLHSYPYFETSAKNGEGVIQAFEKLLTLILSSKRQAPADMTVPNACPFQNSTNYMERNEPSDILNKRSVIFRLLHGTTEHKKLGLPVLATVEEINKRYRQLAKLLHPDKSEDPRCEEAFKALVVAKNNLLQVLEK